MATVYERIDELCNKKGVTHGKMCDDLGYSRTTMSALKSGRSTTFKLEKAKRIAEYFNVSVDYLMGEEDQKEKPGSVSADELSPELKRVIELYDKAPPAFQEAALAVLESALKQKQPDR